MKKITNAIISLSFLLIFITSATAGTRYYTGIEQMSGWGSCTSCANGAGSAIYSMTRGTSSPSLDGKSTKFFVGGSTPYSHGLWWKRLGDGESGSRNLVLDIYYYLKTPSASGGLEFNANQSVGGKRYQFSVQCSYILKIWQVWDTYNGRWSKTAAPCTLAPAYKWQHVVFEFQRTSENKARFISINVDGKKMYIDKRFSPKGTSATSLGIHFQLNGNKYQTDYSAWVDKLKLTTF